MWKLKHHLERKLLQMKCVLAVLGRCRKTSVRSVRMNENARQMMLETCLNHESTGCAWLRSLREAESDINLPHLGQASVESAMLLLLLLLLLLFRRTPAVTSVSHGLSFCNLLRAEELFFERISILAKTFTWTRLYMLWCFRLKTAKWSKQQSPSGFSMSGFLFSWDAQVGGCIPVLAWIPERWPLYFMIFHAFVT